MASKATIVNGEERNSPIKRQSAGGDNQLVERVRGTWTEFTDFLGDVRGEMRKVVTPSRKEVQATTTVVIVAVFIFGVYFFVVDGIFQFAYAWLMKQLGAV